MIGIGLPLVHASTADTKMPGALTNNRYTAQAFILPHMPQHLNAVYIWHHDVLQNMNNMTAFCFEKAHFILLQKCLTVRTS